MTIPLFIFLALYLLFVFVWLIFSLVALYHVVKWAQINFITFSATFTYLVVGAALLYWSYLYLSPLDWSAGLSFAAGGRDWFGPGL